MRVEKSERWSGALGIGGSSGCSGEEGCYLHFRLILDGKACSGIDICRPFPGVSLLVGMSILPNDQGGGLSSGSQTCTLKD